MFVKENTSHISVEIEIDATPEQIWSVLFDFDGLQEWSNGFLGTDKPMKVGEISTAYFRNPLTGGKIDFTHEVTIFEPNRSFGWSGDVMLGRHDNHIYTIEPLPHNRSLFRQEDGLFGKPPSMLSKMMEFVIQRSYISFNKKLKKQVEKQFCA